MIVRKTTPEESLRINEIFSIAFDLPLSNCPADPENDKATHWAAFDDDGEMMSNITIPDYTVFFDGHSCKMGGIGGVATLPQYRRRGGIRACFHAALPDMYDNGYAFSFLFPFSTAYYRKFGYECCVQKYHWTIDPRQLVPPQVAGSFRLAEKRCPMTDAIREVDAAWENRFNMMVRHKPEDYGWTQQFDPARKLEFTYVYFDALDTPKAYTTFKVVQENDGRNILCSRFCFVDKEGFAGLMHLFKSLAADHTYVKFHTPALPSLQYLMPEWSLGAAQWRIHHNSGMVRVINAEYVLQKAKYRGSGALTLQLLDSQIPRNNDCFTVTFSDGRATSVQRTQEAPNAIMAISTFSALIAGVCDFDQAVQTFSALEVKKDTPALQQTFYRKDLMIADYF